MNRKGFTLIELLIVLVIIGVLAAIAVPKFTNTKEKVYLTSMKSDLRNLVTAEEAYFTDSVKYTTALSCASPPAPGQVPWCISTGNSLVGITTGSGSQAGWTAAVSNANTSKSCGVYVGAITPAAPVTTADPEGAPVCR